MPGQPPLEGGDRKLRPAALDLRREVEADRFRVGRRLGKPLAAQPGGELSPVGGVGAPGVVGLRRAGVGLGGLRQRRQAAAEAPGGREQGRGVRAGSLRLRRRAFRLPAIRAVSDASREDRASGRMARRRRAGRSRCRRRPARAGRGRLSRRRGTAPGLPSPWRGALPGMRCRAKRGDGAQLRRGPARRRRELSGAGRVPRRGRPRRVAWRRLGAVPGIGGRAPLRVRWPRGLGCD